MNNGIEKFELARDPAWSEAKYLERRRKHDALMRRTAALTLQRAACLVLDLMLAVPADEDPEIEDLLNFLSITERLERTAEFWGWSNPIFEIALTEFKRSIGHMHDLIEFQGKRQ